VAYPNHIALIIIQFSIRMICDADAVQGFSALKCKWLFMPELLHRNNIKLPAK
jgi:hypothetical protein